jgi:hypothetical protein
MSWGSSISSCWENPPGGLQKSVDSFHPDADVEHAAEKSVHEGTSLEAVLQSAAGPIR